MPQPMRTFDLALDQELLVLDLPDGRQVTIAPRVDRTTSNKGQVRLAIDAPGLPVARAELLPQTVEGR